MLAEPNKSTKMDESPPPADRPQDGGESRQPSSDQRKKPPAKDDAERDRKDRLESLRDDERRGIITHW